MRKPTIALLVVLALLCLVASAGMWRRAFPIAGVDFRLSRDDARLRLAGIVEKLGHPLAGYRSAITFAEDDDTKRFLELEHGVPALEQRTRQGLNIWYWTARWFRPAQHEEFSAQLDPQGWLVGYRHTIEEERELPSLDAAAARTLAEDFLRKFASHHVFDRLVFLEESHEQEAHRLDWTFTWERPDLRFGAARYRLVVTVQGNEIGAYGESLDVPESWTRSFAEKRESNDLFQSLANYATMPLAVGTFVLLILYIRRRQLDRRALPWGWLVLFAAVQLGMELNGLPELFFGYETTEQWHSFLSGAALSAVRSVLLTPLSYWLLVILADAIYREQLPQHPSLRRALGAGALRDPHTLRALGLGIVLAAVALAYVPGYYLVAQKLGAWCPVEVDYTGALSGWFPWLGGMNTGLSAAFSEELFFRVLGVLLLVKVLRVRWLAVLLACTTWAFLHSSYDQMPGYLRGIELTVEGVLWGWVVLRFGVIATLTAHYLFNCTLGSIVVFQSPTYSDKTGAVAVAIWPVALFAWGCWQRRQERSAQLPEFMPEETAQVPEVRPVLPARVWDFTPRRFTPRQRWTITGAAVAVMTALYFLPLPQDRMLALGQLDLSRTEIGHRADTILHERGFRPETWRRVISMGTWSAPAKYLLRYGSVDALAQLFGVEWPDVQWSVRYFRIGEREELGVTLDQHGKLVRWSHSILREAPGAALDRDAALALARAALARERGVDLEREKLVSESVTEQEKRRDHYFEFQRIGWTWGESELRTSATVQGDEVIDISRWVKVPESFDRQEAKSGWRDLVAREISEWTRLALAVFVVVIFILLLRKELAPWRLGFVLALIPVTLSLVTAANDLPWFFASYSTTTPLPHFFTKKLLGGALGFAGAYLGQVLLISVTLGLVAWAFGWTPRAFAQSLAADPRPRRIWRDALPLVVTTIALLWVEHALPFLALSHWFPWRAVAYHTPDVNHALPWLACLAQALSRGWNETVSTALSAALVALVFRRFPRLTIAALLLYPIKGAIGADNLGNFFYQVATAEFSLLLHVWLVIFVWRFNPLVIFASYTGLSLLSWITIFLRKGGPAYQWDGIILLALTLIVIGALGWHGRMRRGVTT
jgi:hypothetical protein